MDDYIVAFFVVAYGPNNRPRSRGSLSCIASYFPQTKGHADAHGKDEQALCAEDKEARSFEVLANKEVQANRGNE